MRKILFISMLISSCFSQLSFGLTGEANDLIKERLMKWVGTYRYMGATLKNGAIKEEEDIITFEHRNKERAIEVKEDGTVVVKSEREVWEDSFDFSNGLYNFQVLVRDFNHTRVKDRYPSADLFPPIVSDYAYFEVATPDSPYELVSSVHTDATPFTRTTVHKQLTYDGKQITFRSWTYTRRLTLTGWSPAEVETRPAKVFELISHTLPDFAVIKDELMKKNKPCKEAL